VFFRAKRQRVEEQFFWFEEAFLSKVVVGFSVVINQYSVNLIQKES
jgi:hypothetical protein